MSGTRSQGQSWRRRSAALPLCSTSYRSSVRRSSGGPVMLHTEARCSPDCRSYEDPGSYTTLPAHDVTSSSRHTSQRDCASPEFLPRMAFTSSWSSCGKPVWSIRPSRSLEADRHPQDLTAGTRSASQAKPPSRVLSKPPPAAADDSVTEEEPEEDDHAAPAGKGKIVPQYPQNTHSRDGSPARSVPSKRATPDQSPPPKSPDNRKVPSPPTSSSPPLPKKAKRAQVSDSSDEDDSEEERKKRLARLKGSSTRGAKQPVKRGGRRF